MTTLTAVLLGIVEGITEFLPVSSTGHLILAADWLAVPETEALKTFEIAIQLGAILAAVVLYWHTLIRSRETLKKVIIAFIPTAIIGFALHGTVKTYLLGSQLTVIWSLLIGGIVLIAFELLHGERATARGIEEMSVTDAVIIGLFQSVAIIPGVSRAASTIIGGMLLGFSRRTVVDFSFLIAIPTMLGATGLDLIKSAPSLTGNDMFAIAIGFLVSFIVAIATIKWLLGFIKNHSFILFGAYRIILAAVMLLI